MKKRYMSDLENKDWEIPDVGNGNTANDDAHLCLLGDIRRELQELNMLLYCRSFQQIPHTLKKIERNTTKKRVRK